MFLGSLTTPDKNAQRHQTNHVRFVRIQQTRHQPRLKLMTSSPKNRLLVEKMPMSKPSPLTVKPLNLLEVVSPKKLEVYAAKMSRTFSRELLDKYTLRGSNLHISQQTSRHEISAHQQTSPKALATASSKVLPNSGERLAERFLTK